MTIQTDVKASARLGASGAFLNAAGQPIGRCRIKGIYGVGGAAGSIVITDGVGGTPLLPLDTVVGVANMEVPGEGILCANGPAGVLAGATGVVLFYG
jgi:hypothetical protein